MKLPKARTENLVEQNLGAEILIYNLLTHKAFNLNETLSIVYQNCDGETSFGELKNKYKFTDDFIYLALDELKRSDLLAKDAVYSSPFAKTSRREVIKKVGLATMLALPLIAGLVAPQASNAASAAGGLESDYLPLYSACVNQLGAKQCITAFCVGGFCCQESALNQQINLLPGQTYSITDTGSPQLFPIGQEPGETACPVGCCSGASPTGGCTYVVDTINYPPDELAELRETGYAPYIATCNCVC